MPIYRVITKNISKSTCGKSTQNRVETKLALMILPSNYKILNWKMFCRFKDIKSKSPPQSAALSYSWNPCTSWSVEDPQAAVNYCIETAVS